MAVGCEPLVDMAEDLSTLRADVWEFIEARDWAAYHTPKSVAMAIAIEASEILELFQWHDNLEASAYEESVRNEVRDELADVLIYSLSLAEQFDIDLGAAVADKLEANERRFDADRVASMNEHLDRWQSE